MCGVAVDGLVVVDDACEVDHGCLAFPGLAAVNAGGSVLVVGEGSLLDVLDAVVSPDE